MVAEHIAGTDDHRRLLTNTSESDEDRHKRDAQPSRHYEELKSGLILEWPRGGFAD